jgi:ABC-type dipeptide/oligopeptide/nickel transport system permease component
MKAQYKLDSPWAFYWDYLGKASGVSWLMNPQAGTTPFDLGPSLTHENWSINQILGDSLPVSIILGLVAMLLACVIGITAGVIGGVKPGSFWDVCTLMIAAHRHQPAVVRRGHRMLVIFPCGSSGCPSAAGAAYHLILPGLTLTCHLRPSRGSRSA